MQYIRGNHEVNQVSPDCGLQKGHLGYCSSLGKEKQRHKHEQMRLNFPPACAMQAWSQIKIALEKPKVYYLLKNLLVQFVRLNYIYSTNSITM